MTGRRTRVLIVGDSSGPPPTRTSPAASSSSSIPTFSRSISRCARQTRRAILVILGPRPARLRESTLVAIGASTGGAEAIARVLANGSRPIFPRPWITQHIPAGFSRAFSERLNRLCAMEVKQAEDCGYRVVVKDGPHVCYQRPSVDVLLPASRTRPRRTPSARFVTVKLVA